MLLALVVPAAAVAQTTPTVEFNFAPVPGAQRGNFPNVICNMPGYDDYMCSKQQAGYGNGDVKTPFVQETMDLNGRTYFHVVVGQPEQGFAQELYIRTGSSLGSFGAGFFSDSGGGACFVNNGMPFETMIACAKDLNATNPLGPVNPSGNGTGNPNASIMKQIVSDGTGSFSQEFLKAELEKKPKITQNYNMPGLEGQFIVDMSNSDYKTDNVTGTVTLQLEVKDPGFAGGSSAFDLAKTTSAAPNIDAGRYTYTPNTNSVKRATGDSWTYGTYTYWDGSVDRVYDIDWTRFRDPLQNQ
jgi:hypothetical protein